MKIFTLCSNTLTLNANFLLLAARAMAYGVQTDHMGCLDLARARGGVDSAALHTGVAGGGGAAVV